MSYSGQIQSTQGRKDRQVGQGRAVMAEQEPDTDGKPGDNKEEAEQVGQQLS